MGPVPPAPPLPGLGQCPEVVAVSVAEVDVVAPEGSGDGPGHCISLEGSGEAVAQRNCVLFWFLGKKGGEVCV